MQQARQHSQEQAAPARADRNHDEHDLKSFEEYGFEAGKRSEPIEPRLVPASLLAQLRRFGREGHSFIMERNDSRRAEDRLSQPAHAEQQQQDPDRELKEMQRDKIEQRAEQQHDEDEQHKASERSKPGRTPAANSGDRQQDGQRLDGLNKRAKECR